MVHVREDLRKTALIIGIALMLLSVAFRFQTMMSGRTNNIPKVKAKVRNYVPKEHQVNKAHAETENSNVVLFVGCNGLF